jgi:hypothetical protein
MARKTGAEILKRFSSENEESDRDGNALSPVLIWDSWNFHPP